MKIYHNPRCSKSRKALELIRAAGLEPEVVDYMRTPLTASEIRRLLKRLNMQPLELMRKGEDLYKELGVGTLPFSKEELIRILAENPRLMERPIVVTETRAAVCRPPEKVTELL
jgi:arsenate reductase